VLPTSLAEAERANVRDRSLEFVMEEHKRGDSLRTARLTNRGANPVTFPAYVCSPGGVGPPGSEVPIGALVQLQHWNPREGWVQERRHTFCGTGLGCVTLNSGQSQRIALPPVSAGVYRFSIDTNRAADADWKDWQRAEATTDAVAIEWWQGH
jgi:hypothetical protein